MASKMTAFLEIATGCHELSTVAVIRTDQPPLEDMPLNLTLIRRNACPLTSSRRGAGGGRGAGRGGGAGAPEPRGSHRRRRLAGGAAHRRRAAGDLLANVQAHAHELVGGLFFRVVQRRERKGRVAGAAGPALHGALQKGRRPPRGSSRAAGHADSCPPRCKSAPRPLSPGVLLPCPAEDTTWPNGSTPASGRFGPHGFRTYYRRSPKGAQHNVADKAVGRRAGAAGFEGGQTKALTARRPEAMWCQEFGSHRKWPARRRRLPQKLRKSSFMRMSSPRPAAARGRGLRP